MNTNSDMQLSLRLYRYSVFTVALTAFIVSLFSPVIMTANPNFGDVSLSFDDMFIPSLMVTGAVLLVGIVSYFVFVWYIRANVRKHSVIG